MPLLSSIKGGFFVFNHDARYGVAFGKCVDSDNFSIGMWVFVADENCISMNGMVFQEGYLKNRKKGRTDNSTNGFFAIECSTRIAEMVVQTLLAHQVFEEIPQRYKANVRLGIASRTRKMFDGLPHLRHTNSAKITEVYRATPTFRAEVAPYNVCENCLHIGDAYKVQVSQGGHIQMKRTGLVALVEGKIGLNAALLKVNVCENCLHIGDAYKVQDSQGGHIQTEQTGLVALVDGKLLRKGTLKNCDNMGKVCVLVNENVLSAVIRLLKMSAQQFFLMQNLNVMFVSFGSDNCVEKSHLWHLAWKDIVYAGDCDVDMITMGPKLGLFVLYPYSSADRFLETGLDLYQVQNDGYGNEVCNADWYVKNGFKAPFMLDLNNELRNRITVLCVPNGQYKNQFMVIKKNRDCYPVLEQDTATEVSPVADLHKVDAVKITDMNTM